MLDECDKIIKTHTFELDPTVGILHSARVTHDPLYPTTWWPEVIIPSYDVATNRDEINEGRLVSEYEYCHEDVVIKGYFKLMKEACKIFKYPLPGDMLIRKNVKQYYYQHLDSGLVIGYAYWLSPATRLASDRDTRCHLVSVECLVAGPNDEELDWLPVNQKTCRYFDFVSL